MKNGFLAKQTLSDEERRCIESNMNGISHSTTSDTQLGNVDLQHHDSEHQQQPKPVDVE